MAAQPDPEVLNIAKKYLQALRDNHYQFDSAWLFGSYARQTADQDSDIDIALFMKNVGTKFFLEVELMRFRRSIDTRIEPHVLDAADLDNPFAEEILKTGVPIQ
jgi:uncharacterized protein